MNDKILQDVSSTGKVRPWREHKVQNELLSHAYQDVNPDKAKRLQACATRLSFEVDDQDRKKLVDTWFCRVRLCPMCSWRRSLKVAAQMHAIMDAIKQDKPCAYILVTFTMRNCTAETLDSDVTRFIQGFANLVRRKPVQDATQGWYRSVEITHNLDEDTYHPHIHAIFSVPPGYFASKLYISQQRWTDLWQHAIHADYTPVVDVRRIKGNTASAVAEVAKYAVKSSDYLIPDDWDLTVHTVRLLDAVLHKRRFIAFGGIFKDYHKRLNLDDADQGDLVHTDPDQQKHDYNNRTVCFAWYSGYRQYHKD